MEEDDWGRVGGGAVLLIDCWEDGKTELSEESNMVVEEGTMAEKVVSEGGMGKVSLAGLCELKAGEMTRAGVSVMASSRG